MVQVAMRAELKKRTPPHSVNNVAALFTIVGFGDSGDSEYKATTVTRPTVWKRGHKCSKLATILSELNLQQEALWDRYTKIQTMVGRGANSIA
jgi:hypothetical protein